jgi:Fe2+ transport system protein FeoA
VDVTLAEVRVGDRVRVLNGWKDVALAVHLAGIGLHVGDEAVVLRTAPFGGPLLVEVPATGVRVAIARAVAARVRVRPASAATE